MLRRWIFQECSFKKHLFTCFCNLQLYTRSSLEQIMVKIAKVFLPEQSLPARGISTVRESTKEDLLVPLTQWCEIDPCRELSQWCIEMLWQIHALHLSVSWSPNSQCNVTDSPQILDWWDIQLHWIFSIDMDKKKKFIHERTALGECQVENRKKPMHFSCLEF